jgi:hypothetical protein
MLGTCYLNGSIKGNLNDFFRFKGLIHNREKIMLFKKLTLPCVTKSIHLKNQAAVLHDRECGP